MSESPTQYKLPIPLANWPWQRRLNPHYPEVKAESDAWVQSFHPFEPKEQKKFNLCNLSMFELRVIRMYLAQPMHCIRSSRMPDVPDGEQR